MKIFGSALVFVAEMGMIVALWLWGYSWPDRAIAWIVGIGLPLAVATFWGMFLAPRATMPLARPVQTVLRMFLLLGGAAAFFAVGATALGGAQAGCAVVGTLLADVLSGRADAA